MSYTFLLQNGDLVFRSSGQAITVSGTDKAAQDVLDVVTRSYNPETGYGNKLIENAQFAVPLSQGDASLAIQGSIESLMALQSGDDTITDEERIKEIGTLIVEFLNDTDMVWLGEFYVAASTVSRRFYAEAKITH